MDITGEISASEEQILLTDSKAAAKPHTNQFACDICNKSFYKIKNLKRHQKLHKEEKSYQCPKCPRAYTRSDHLKRHLVSHKENAEDQKPFQCKMCIQRFSNRSHLNRHVANMHLKDKLVQFECEKCTESFNKKRKLNRHLLLEHNEDGNNGKNFECYYPYCSKSYYSKGKLDLHIQKHHSTNIEAVNLVEKNDKNRENNENNEKCENSQNINQKNFIQCPFKNCFKCYTKMFNLKVHIKTFHYNLEEFKCGDCGKAFKHKCTLIKHQRRVHSNTYNNSELDLPLDLEHLIDFESLIETKTN